MFASWKRGGFGIHRLTGPKGRAATVGIRVHCRSRRGRRGKHGRERLVYAYRGWSPPSPGQVSELYRARFGTETSYRQMNQCRARTCTRDPGVRLFLVAVALVLRSVWAWLHREALAGPRRGGRVLRLEALTLKALLQMLLQVAFERFGFPEGARTERPIPQELEA